MKIEGTDLFAMMKSNSSSYGIGKIENGEWVNVSIPNSNFTNISSSPIWTNNTTPSFGYLGSLVIFGTWNTTEVNTLFKWNSSTSNYEKISTTMTDIIGFTSEYKAIGYDVSTKTVTEYTIDENFNVLSSRVLFTNVVKACCIWLPNEQEGIITIRHGNSLELVVASLETGTDNYITTSVTGYGGDYMFDKGYNGPFYIGMSGDLAGTVSSEHPVEGYLSNRKYIKKLPSLIRFNNPPSNGESVTIDVTNKYLYKTSDLVIKADWKMSCQ